MAIGCAKRKLPKTSLTQNVMVKPFFYQSTHIVCNDTEKAEGSYKCKMGGKFGIPVVSMKWIRASIEADLLQNTDYFLMVGKSKSDGLKEGKISGNIGL